MATQISGIRTAQRQLLAELSIHQNPTACWPAPRSLAARRAFEVVGYASNDPAKGHITKQQGDRGKAERLTGSEAKNLHRNAGDDETTYAQAKQRRYRCMYRQTITL